MKTKLIAGLLLAGSCLFAAPRVSIGVAVGTPAPVYAPAPYVAPVYAAPAYAAPAYVAPAYVPPPAPVYAPGPGYAWVSGYWYGVGPRRVWHGGYWAPRHGYVGGRVYYRR
jgi:hypothetical protein